MFYRKKAFKRTSVNRRHCDSLFLLKRRLVKVGYRKEVLVMVFFGGEGLRKSSIEDKCRSSIDERP